MALSRATALPWLIPWTLVLGTGLYLSLLPGPSEDSLRLSRAWPDRARREEPYSVTRALPAPHKRVTLPETHAPGTKRRAPDAPKKGETVTVAAPPLVAPATPSVNPGPEPSPTKLERRGPPSGHKIPHYEDTRSVAFAWKLVGKKAHGHFQWEIAPDQNFSSIAKSVVCSHPHLSVNLAPLYPGTYYWRVRFLETEGETRLETQPARLVLGGGLPLLPPSSKIHVGSDAGPTSPLAPPPSRWFQLPDEPGRGRP